MEPLKNFYDSLVRTYTPLLVGLVLSWLAVNFGIVVPEDLALEATLALTGALQGVYYLAVRLWERKKGSGSKLLGVATKPDYDGRALV